MTDKRIGELTEAIRQILEKQPKKGFGDFIVARMGEVLSGDEKTDHEARKKAFREFRLRSENYTFASLPTMRHWFGLGGISVPSREHIFEMGLVLQLGREETECYLKQGLREPSFQVNDYREIIVLYSLDNWLTLEECRQLISDFEGYMASIVKEEFTHTTKELWEQYEKAKEQPRKDFYLWLTEHAGWFRGYSKTTQEYLQKLRKTILNEMKKDAREHLLLLLGETDYARWKKSYSGSLREEKDLIHLFLKREGKGENSMTADLRQTIRELYRLAYREWDANTQLRAELYNNHESAKHLSDLFNIPILRNREYQMRYCFQLLEGLEDEIPCPEQVRQWGIDLTRKEDSFETVEAAKIALEEYRREIKRRNLLVQRSDLFPMVLQLSQIKYRESNPEKYDQKTARELFVDMADKVANACNMLPLDEEYEQDQLLLACFQEKEMYSYAEAMDELAKLRMR